MKKALSLLFCLLLLGFSATVSAQSDGVLSTNSSDGSCGDALVGTSANNRIDGNSSNETLFVEVGSECLDGENGHGNLTGGSSMDVLHGGIGPDVESQGGSVSPMSGPPDEFCGDFELSCVGINAGLYGDVCPERCIISPHIKCGFCSRSPGPNGPETCICTV